jgi:hypothetical protein
VNHGFNCTASKDNIALHAESAEVEFRNVQITYQAIDKIKAYD